MKHLTKSIMNEFKITVINELKEHIKSNLKETIKNELKESIESDKKAELNHDKNRFNERNNLNNLIANLEKDVEFLHKEIDSKNKIIEILVGDKNQSSMNKANLQKGVGSAGANKKCEYNFYASE